MVVCALLSEHQVISIGGNSRISSSACWAILADKNPKDDNYHGNEFVLWRDGAMDQMMVER